ncbi:MAG: lipoprotein [Dehalococcoidia bacterium]|nr:lipoprotein [Dehalococcoidia bacterium]
MSRLRHLWTAGWVLLAVSACAASSPQTPQTHGSMEMRLTDAPASNGLSLLVTISRMQVKAEGDWQTVAAGPIRVDLTTLIGSEQSLGTTRLPAGTYTKVRFVVDNPAISHSGDETPADVGAKTPVFEMKAEVSEGRTAVVVVDIDGAASFAYNGERPVFDVVAEVSVRYE